MSSSIVGVGVGAAKRFNAIRWPVVTRMLWAGVLTLPITAALSYLIAWLLAPLS